MRNFANVLSQSISFTYSLLLIWLAIFVSVCSASDREIPLYHNAQAAVDDRVADLLGRLTLEEKLDLMGGNPKTEFDNEPILRLGVPSMTMADGPHGIRPQYDDENTCFPTSVTMAATWNEGLVNQVGTALAREALARGRNVLLGPCINLHRNCYGGRNFESFSEDPYLASRMAVAYIKGVQSQHVIAVPKHFAANNQEYQRTTINIDVDERTLRELYLPAFQASIQEGGALSIMAAYNKILGDHASQSKKLLTDILRNEWGFKGFVMSDWGAVTSTIPSVLAGLDMEMPFSKYYGEPLKKAVESGEVPISVIDYHVSNILRAMFTIGMFDNKCCYDGRVIDSSAHRAIALEVAREGIVLLKNQNHVLPLDRKHIRSIAVIGPNADQVQLGGWGSSMVQSTYQVTPLEGILKKTHGQIDVKSAVGCDLELPGGYETIPTCCFTPPDAPAGAFGLKAEYYAGVILNDPKRYERIDRNVDFFWHLRDPIADLRHDNFSVRWTGMLTPPVDGAYTLSTETYGGMRLWIDNKLVIDDSERRWNRRAKAGTIELKSGQPYAFRCEYYGVWGGAMARLRWMLPKADTIAEAARLARESDVAIVVVGLDMRYEGEGHGNDRKSLNLPGQQDELIEAVAKANPNTIVVLVNGTPLLMDRWLDRVAGVVETWYGGQEGGQALADVLFGDFNPSGRMPTTFPKKPEDHSAFGYYPGSEGVVHFTEGLLMGYRHFDAKNIEPLFAFGYGLSYTTFEYTDLEVKPAKAAIKDEIQVSMEVENTGSQYGQEVVQLYVAPINPAQLRAPKQLKAFKKVGLWPGEKKAVHFVLNQKAFNYYNTDAGQWKVDPGKYDILIGSSSRNIKLKDCVRLD